MAVRTTAAVWPGVQSPVESAGRGPATVEGLPLWMIPLCALAGAQAVIVGQLRGNLMAVRCVSVAGE